MLEEFAEVARGLSFARAADPDRVQRDRRGRVRASCARRSTGCDMCARRCGSATGCAGWARRACASFLELGPDGVLSAMAQDCLAGGAQRDDGRAMASWRLPLLRGERPEARALIGALAQLWVRGVEVDWEAVFAGTGARRVRAADLRLPARALLARRRRPGGRRSGRGRSGRGRSSAAGRRGCAGRRTRAGCSRVACRCATHPWLADHAVMGTVLLPGTAFVELALHVGGRVGCERAAGADAGGAAGAARARRASQLQVSLGGARRGGRADGEHPLPCPSDGHGDGPRGRGGVDVPRQRGALPRGAGRRRDGVAGANGGLAARAWTSGRRAGTPSRWTSTTSTTAWPSGASTTGPAFQGLRAAWRRGDELFAEVSLPGGRADRGGQVRAAPRAARCGAARARIEPGRRLGRGRPAEASVLVGRGAVVRGGRVLAAGAPVAGGPRRGVRRGGRRGRRGRSPSVDSLMLRPVSGRSSSAATSAQATSRCSRWTGSAIPVACRGSRESAGRSWATSGRSSRVRSRAAGAEVEAHAGSATRWLTPLDDGARAPEPGAVRLRLRRSSAEWEGRGGPRPRTYAVRVACWISCRRGSPTSGSRRSRLVLVTRGAVAAVAGGGCAGSGAGAPCWGLVRSAAGGGSRAVRAGRPRR